MQLVATGCNITTPAGRTPSEQRELTTNIYYFEVGGSRGEVEGTREERERNYFEAVVERSKMLENVRGTPEQVESLNRRGTGEKYLEMPRLKLEKSP